MKESENMKESEKIEKKEKIEEEKEMKFEELKKTKVIVPDTSVMIDGRITDIVKSGELKGVKIIFHKAAIGELEHQANRGKEVGFSGLTEIKLLRNLAKEGKIVIGYGGKRSSELMIKGARFGEIDAAIRDLAKKKNAILLTSDRVQSEVAKAEGISVAYFEPKVPKIELTFKRFLTPDTVSLHFKENTLVMAKIGKPEEVKLVTSSENKITRKELEDMTKEIIETARRDEQSYIETDEKGATVIQLREFRIVIAKPPFSDGIEITIVRPIIKATLEEYGLSEKLEQRLKKRAEGIIVCGAPGSGKSTFVSALAIEYFNNNKIVKTLESPRDLQVPDEITQYAPLNGSFEKTSDILLLVRPDYSIYDEMRKTSDFKVFTDMRLSGIGMIGVVHSTRPIEAIYRFLGRIDLGIIPQIVDTVIFIKGGKIKKTLELGLKVKIPRGMRDRDLARPVVEVTDFETGNTEYEIYKFGDETICIPVIMEDKKKDRKFKRHKR